MNRKEELIARRVMADSLTEDRKESGRQKQTRKESQVIVPCLLLSLSIDRVQ